MWNTHVGAIGLSPMTMIRAPEMTATQRVALTKPATSINQSLPHPQTGLPSATAAKPGAVGATAPKAATPAATTSNTTLYIAAGVAALLVVGTVVVIKKRKKKKRR